MLELNKRFWSHVAETGNICECWEWVASLKPQGYGQIRIDGKTRYAHRVSYELTFGKISGGLYVDHLCRNRSCVNPWHLEPVSNAENIRRGEGGKFYKEKEFCPRNHPYDHSNTYVNTRGSRVCRSCKTIRARSLRQ